MKRLFSACLLSTLLAGCYTTSYGSVRPATTADRDRANCVSDYNRQVDYFPNKANIKYAQRFEVEYRNNYKIVTVKNPWKGAGVSFQYVLVQCGTPIPEGFDRDRIIRVPVESAVALATPYLAHLDRLQLLDRLVGVSNAKRINTPGVVAKLKTNEIAALGTNPALNIEAILNLNPDLILTFGMGNAQFDTHPKLLEANLNVALNAAYLETSPLARAEWIKFTALFFNREAKAEQIFAEIDREYHRIAKRVRDIKDRPTALAGFNRNGTWYVPGGQSYFARLLADAGADYLWKDNSERGSIPLDFEAVYNKAVNADIWLNVSQAWQTKSDVVDADSRYAHFAAWQGDRIYNNTARVNPHGGNDYWESGVVNPHIILADLVKIFHPEVLDETEKTYYQKLD
jgi:iron complex transport system substrate-binding protein